MVRRKLVETRQNTGKRQRRNRIEKGRERERVEENGQGEAKFTGSVCRERRPPWGIDRERESNGAVGRSEEGRRRRGKEGGGDVGSREVREVRFKP